VVARNPSPTHSYIDKHNTITHQRSNQISDRFLCSLPSLRPSSSPLHLMDLPKSLITLLLLSLLTYEPFVDAASDDEDFFSACSSHR
jgi:hypothetical protein